MFCAEVNYLENDVGRRHPWYVHTNIGKLRSNKQSMLICKL